ncbi:MAG: hypothetical protein JWO67_4516 [Streptosporangiaceae bacterium]|nr:hypothetical protein [Streptosporangiaceae bacterium]
MTGLLNVIEMLTVVVGIVLAMWWSMGVFDRRDAKRDAEAEKRADR